MKTHKLLCASILALVLWAAAAAQAQAGGVALEPGGIWYAKNHVLAEAEPLPVKLHGVTSIYLGEYAQRVSCRTRGEGTIENVADEGYGEITELRFGHCRFEASGSEEITQRVCEKHSRLELTSFGPLYGYLNEYQQIAFEGLELELSCSGLYPLFMEGPITGLVGVDEIQFGDEYGETIIEPNDLFTGVWRIHGPGGARRVTAIKSLPAL